MTLKHHNSFQNENNRKNTHTVLLPNLNKKFENSVMSLSLPELELPKNLPGDKIFNPKKSKI